MISGTQFRLIDLTACNQGKGDHRGPDSVGKWSVGVRVTGYPY
jgi:hypothetical protein